MRLLAPTFWGWLADYTGRRLAVIVGSSVLTIVSFSLFLIFDNFWGIFLGMGLTFFFWTAAHPLVEALTLAHLQGRTEDYGHIRLWGSVGFVGGVLGVGALLDVAALPSLLWVCLLLLIAVTLFSLLLDDPGVAPTDLGDASLWRGLRRPAVLTLLAACFFMSIAHGPLYTFFSIHLVTHGYGKSLVGLFWSLGVVAEILVFMLMPRLLRRYSLRTILLASFALAVLRFLVIGWFAELPVFLFLAQLMHAATFGAYHVAAVTALNRGFPASQQGRVQGIYGSISFGAGGIVGNLLSGQFWESWGGGWTYTLAAAFALVGWVLVWRGFPARDSASD
jgi:PPP family 3-phenylpropionic acid transporter